MTRYGSRGLLVGSFALYVFTCAGCASALEERTRTELSSFEKHTELRPPPDQVPSFDGSLNGYLAFAIEHSPEVRAAFERWRASIHSTSRGRRLPEPSLSFGYFIRSVETRVGPQRFRVGIAQTFPWPTRLSARADAAGEAARAARRVVDAELLRVKRDVADAYWTLWLIHEEHRLTRVHDAVLEALAGAVRGRLQTGGASLADLSQIELNIARHHDHKGSHEQDHRKASAMLLAALGIQNGGQELHATDQPVAGTPVADIDRLRADARTHPRISTHDHLARSQDRHAKAERAERFPSLRLGLDYIQTDEAAMAGVPDSGKDPLIVSAGVSIPLWVGSYSDAENAARAAARAHRADQEAAVRRAESALETVLADLRDALRRIELYEHTMVPQAETTFQAVLGSYQTGRSTVTAVILAQRDLLELQIEHVRARAEHARAWARLEYIVGNELDRKETP